jgi:hypothetical protein
MKPKTSMLNDLGIQRGLIDSFAPLATIKDVTGRTGTFDAKFSDHDAEFAAKRLGDQPNLWLFQKDPFTGKRNIAFAKEYVQIIRMTTLVCNIPEKLDARLEKLARQAKVPKEKFVRNALELAVRAPHAKGSAFSLVKNLCGSLSGPSDMSTNPKYLEALGG